MLRTLDLFSGIGGFSLGLERTGGFQTVAFCEIDPYCRRVLAKHWPHVPCYDDVRTLTGLQVGSADVLTGGFPCQDISIAGRRSGLEGEHSGLWSEIARLVGELRPRYVILENSPSLCVRGLDRILGDLADAGYDAEWSGIPAAAIGAPHLRAREWVLAYPVSIGNRLQAATILPRWIAPVDGHRWACEPEISRVDDGLPARVDRRRVLGNTVVPAIPELIGHAILEAERH